MRLNSTIKIGNTQIGARQPAFIIAEISANHCGSFNRAVELIHAAKYAGADAVKLQTYTADTLTIDCDKPEFLIEGTVWNGQKLYDLYNDAHTPWDWQPKLKTIANEIGIELFSSPFDLSAVDFLQQMNVPAFKIASFEIGDVELLSAVAKTGKPVILSTGMAELEEIDFAVETLWQNGAVDIAVLKCTSAYPSPPESMNINTIEAMVARYGCPCGLSDHSLTHDAAIASVCVGGSIIEKHLTLSRQDGGPDAAFSLEPLEFAELVNRVRSVEKALGSVQFGPCDSDRSNRVFRRSLFVVKDVEAGETFTGENVRSIRPGHGLEPRFFSEVVGKTAIRAIKRGTPLGWEHVTPHSSDDDSSPRCSVSESCERRHV